MTMYLAYRHGHITGVFSSREKAAACAEKIREIVPAQIEGSPDFAGYILMAQGSVSMMSMVDGRAVSEIYEIGPAWGVNVQSAAAELFGPMFSRRTLSLDRLTIYEADRDYAAAAPLTFAERNPFRHVAERIGQCGAVTEDVVKTDYLGRYFEDVRRLEERLSAHGYREGEMICGRLMELACEDAGRRGISDFGAAQLERAEVRLLNRLHNTFTPAQLKCLVWLMKLTDEPAPEAGAVPAEQHALLLEKAMRFVPRLKRQRRLIDAMDEIDKINEE